MKNKRNSVSSLFLACALFANVSFAATSIATDDIPLAVIDDSSITGTWYSESDDGAVTAFDKDDLYYSISTKKSIYVTGTAVGSSTSNGTTTYVVIYTYSDGTTSSTFYDTIEEANAAAESQTSSTVTSTGYYTVPLGNTYTETRLIDYSYESVDGVIYITDNEGTTSEWWGWKESLTAVEDTDGDIIGYTDSDGNSVTTSDYKTYYFDKEQSYLIIEGSDIDMSVTAIASNGDATALDLKGLVTSYSEDTATGTTTTTTTNGISDGATMQNNNYTLGFTEIIAGGMSISATAVATGGNATGVIGYLKHTTFNVDLANTDLISLDNGDLNLNIGAVATAAYGTSWVGGTAIGIQYVDSTNTTTTVTTDSTDTTTADNGITTAIYADSGTSTVNITAVATGAGSDDNIADTTYIGAFGVIGDVYLEAGTANIGAYAYAIEDYKLGSSTQTGSTSGSAIAIDGDADFVGTKVTLNAYSESGYANAVSGDLTLTSGASLNATVSAGSTTEATATVASIYALGVANATLTDATLTANVYALEGADSATGATSVTATNSSVTLNAIAMTSGATATGATTVELLGSSSLSITAISAEGTATGVTNLNLGYLSSGDKVSVDIYAAGTSATGVTYLGTLGYDGVHSQNATVTITAIATGDSAKNAATATGILNNGIDLSDDTNYEVETFTGYISAIASYTSTSSATVTATAVTGSVYGGSDDLVLAGSYSASAAAIAETAATATAKIFTGTVEVDVSATITAIASATSSTAAASATAYALEGLTGDFSGTLIAKATSDTASDTALDTASATAIGSTTKGDISGTVSASASSTNSTATAIAINLYSEGTISGTVSASATSTNGAATATAVQLETSSTATNTIISGTITASAASEGNATATALKFTATAASVTFDDATITASATSDSGTATANAIDASNYSLTTYGDATVSGDITAGTLTLGGYVDSEFVSSTLTQVSGNLNLTSLTVSNVASNYSMGFDVDGNLPTINGTVTYSYATDADTQSTALSSMLTATAAALVGDSYDLSGTIVFGDTASSTAIENIADNTSVEGANGLDYNLSGGTVTVTNTTYFQDKTSDSNANAIAAKLDSLTTSAVSEVYVDSALASDNYTYNGVDYYSAEELAKAAAEEEAEAADLATRTFKTTVDNMNLDSFVPHANSQIAQTNAETFSNLSVANVWRMRSLMSESSKTAREKAVEAIMANPEFDGIDPDPTAKPKRVAQFQSVNLIGSRDGGSNAPDYDFISTGGTADMDFFFGNDLVAGVGLGGVYNKTDAGSTGGVAESTSFIVNAYAMWSKDELEVFGTLGYAHSFNESSKSTTDGTAKSKWDSDSLYNLAGVAYSVDFENGLILRPMAMYSLVFQNYGETKSVGSNTYNAKVDSTYYVNFRTLIGAELVYSVSDQFEILARLFWSHEFLDNSYDFDYSNDFLSSLGTLSYQGEEADRDMFIAGLGLAYRFENGISAYLDYNANISGDYLGHNLNAAVQMKF